MQSTLNSNSQNQQTTMAQHSQSDSLKVHSLQLRVPASRPSQDGKYTRSMPKKDSAVCEFNKAPRQKCVYTHALLKGIAQ